ncbi:MAG TPA: RHS repeat-associated core domain-containing protein [Thermoanaerobaculia bacterium]
MTLRESFHALLLFCVLTAAAPAVHAATLTPQENWNVVLTPVATEFHGHTGLDHHQPSRKLLLSANTPAGQPHSFELLAGDGGHAAFSNVAGLQGDVLVATARDDGQGMSRGGFQPGTVFATTGLNGVIARISADGASVQNPWVVLPNEGAITGLHLDRTGVFGGDLLVVTAGGGVWRVNATATPTRLAALGTRLAGVTVVPDDLLAYGPWAGKVLAGAKELGSVYAIDAQGQSVAFAVGLNPQDLDVVPAHENLYALDAASRKLLGAAEGALTGIIGDILVTQESPGRISRVRWDGTSFVTSGLAEAPALKQVAFSPAGAGAIPAVKQIYEKIAVVRHAPLLNSGRIEGTVWQLTGEDTLFDGTDTITSDLLVPGTPTVTAATTANYGGTIEGTESASPTGYKVALAGNATLRHVVTRTAPITLQDVPLPPVTQGTRDVQVRKAGDPIGDPATLRHLDIAGNAGSVIVPPGTYGRFLVSGRNTLVLGIDGATEPSIYNLEELTLSGGSSLRVAGPVVLRVRNAVTLVGSTVGAADNPKLLRLEVAHGRPADAVKVGGNGVLYAIVRAPLGKITIHGNGRLRGTVACDILQVDGNGVLQITENDIPPPPVNRPPTANAGADHTITLPADTVALGGTASDDGLPTGSTLAITWTKVSGPGDVTFANAQSAATTATFTVPGDYVLKLTASDGQLSSSDTAAVTVIPRNQAPVVDAGAAQTIELPAAAELHGSVTDDALPPGIPVIVTWTVVEAPGEVTFLNAGAAVTTATFSAPGVYTLRLTANDSEFTVADEVVITVLQNVAPTVNAGADATITLPVDTLSLQGTATDDGLPTGSTLAVTWTKVSGPGEVAFGDASSAATSATFSLDGEYVLKLTASDGALSASDTVAVTVIARNEPPVVDAGQPQTIELPAMAELRGTVTDDGLPRGSTVTITWTATGPGPVTFANASAAVTTASFSIPGVYTLRLSASDTELTVTDDVAVTVLKNDPPSVNAGTDQTVVLPNKATLAGTASDDGYPSGSTLEVFWTMVSGPVPVIFHDAFARTTPVTFAASGTYVLRLTASDSQLSASDEVTIVVLPQPFTSRVYTLDADFSEGSLLNVTRSVPHQLQIDDATRTFNFIWVAVSSKGTVVKIDTETGAVLGEYFTSPAGQPRDPSRTTVDNNGNVWAGNRGGNSVVHIGLVENGQCVDRNSNGIIDTSTGYGDIKPWLNTNNANTNGGVSLAQDECILHYTKVTANIVRHVSVTKENDVWVTGWGSSNQGYFDLVDGKTGVVKRREAAVGYGGYGGLVDKSGILWSARKLLRWDTSKPLTGASAVNGMAFGLYGGRATWDRTGKVSQSGTETVWLEDRTPSGASLHGDGEGWNWTSANPAPFSGTHAHQSNINGGVHQHYFDGAGDQLSVEAGDTLFAYVYLDPANPPRQLILQWNNADWNWEHRAYWGENLIGWGNDGTVSRRYMGPLPPTGQWVRLEVPASAVGLEGSGVNWRGYDNHDSYGLCIDSKGNVWNTSLEWNQIHKFAPDGTHLGSFNHGAHNAQGCVVDKNDDVWVAHSRFLRTVGRLRNDGTYVGNITVGDGPTGVAVDAKGKIWATNHNDGTVARIDPNLGPVGQVDFRTPYLGGSLYNYSDMTGSTLTGKPEAGTWSTLYDSKIQGVAWGNIGWTAQVCGDAQLSVSVASSENGTTFGTAVPVTNGASLTVANGRYLRVTVNFKRASSGESPVLYDLSVGTSGYALPAAANTAPTALAGSDLTMTLPEAVKLGGSACDDGFPRGNALAISWTQVSGPGTATFTNQTSTTPSVTFTLAGQYVLRLTVSDGQHSASDDVTVTALPANAAPVVNAGADQTVTLPNGGTLNGTVTDDGLPAGATVSAFWSQVSGPGTVTFSNPSSPVTGAIFPATGTYTLRLLGQDSQRITTDDVVVTVNPSPALNGATLALIAANAGPYVTGTTQPLHATLKNSAGTPLANYGVELTIAGPNASTGSAVTNASGVATFIHSGTNLGTDTVTALVRHTATANINSPAVAMTWAEAAVPAVQGWIGGPLNGSTVTGTIPVTAGVTLTQAAIEYWPASNPSAVTVLASGVQGGAGATLASLDTTTLANGNYVIRLQATDANGQVLVSQVIVTVTGENKPGRLTFTVTDLTVPAAGVPITIKRRYDSLERNAAGDFGYGWSLDIAGPRLDVSPDYDVTITEPGTGRRVTFQFAPTSFGFPFSFLFQPAYVAEAGVYGKLTANGCATMVRTSGGVSCYLSDPVYRPTVYTYTDPYGRVYTMTAAGSMQSLKDLSGNVLTFSANGITSSSGNLTVPFVRDAQGRITQITDPNGRTFRYGYDAAGDLATVTLPAVSTPVSYTYDAGHFFLSSTDPRGNTEASSTYHPDGRLASFTDAVGNTTSYAYSLGENKTIVTYPDGGVATLTHGANGLLLSETNPLGHTTTHTYDANRNKLTETNALQQTTTHTYDARGNPTSTTDSAGKALRWTYNQYGTPATSTDQLGHVQTTKFDASFNPVSISDSLGTRAAFTWDANGNPLTSTDGNGKVTRFTYDPYGNILTKTDPLGRVTSYTYDGMGRVVTMTDARGTTRSTYDALGRLLTLTDPLNQVTRYEYDDNGNKTAQIDAAGKRTTYQYDAANRLTKVTHPDATSTAYTYNFRGQQLTITDEEGHTTSFVYDQAGRQTKIVNPDGTERTFTYDAIGRVTSETDERNRTTRYEYDPACGCSERLTKTTDPEGGVTSYVFDAAGRRIAERDANQRETRFDYDVRGRLIQTTYADGSTTKQTFDAAGRKLTETDQAGRVTRFGYDDAGNLISITDALNQTTVHGYDALNNLVSTTDALGRTTQYEYDALNRLSRRVLPLGMSELYTYDQVGNRVTRTDFRGKQTAFTYDARNRLVRKTPDATLGESSITFTYTPAGQRASMTDASGTTAYSYDARHQRLSKQTPHGTLTYTYDAAGQLASLRSSNANGVSVDYTHDDAQRLASVVDQGLAGGTTTYQYDPAGNVLGSSSPNGMQTAYTYDSLNRATQVTHTMGATVASYAQTLDATGRRLAVTEGNGRGVSYSYDALYRLTGETIAGDASAAANGSVAYTYDPVANRLSRASTLAAVLSTISVYDANDRLANEAYDANGNTRTANGVTYAYDFEDRIRSANGAAVRFVYDGDGNRVAKTADGVTTRYLVDDLSPTGYSQVVEELVAGSVQRVYTYGHTLISQRQQRNGGWDVSFYGHDAHGNVRFLTAAGGTVTDTYAYDAFGIVTSSTGTTPNDYLFSGQQYDRDLGLYFKRARYYSQDRGRFMTMDPMPGRRNDPLTLHRYMFGHADPVNRIDPCGTTAAIEYGGISNQIAIRNIVATRAVGMAVTCLFYKSASAIDSSINPFIPLLYRGCAVPDDDCDEIYGRCVEQEWQPKWNRPAFGPKLPCLDCLRNCRANDGWPWGKCPVDM